MFDRDGGRGSLGVVRSRCLGGGAAPGNRAYKEGVVVKEMSSEA